MGYGDDLLVTSLAAKLKKKYPDRQIVVGIAKNKEAFHSIVYDNNPNITDCRKIDIKKPIHLIDHNQWNRPYIDYKKSTNLRYVWNKDFKPTPGELFFSKQEVSLANKIISQAKTYWNDRNIKKYRAIIFLETTSTKINDKQFSIKHKNKDWGYKNWKNLIEELKNNYLIIHSTHKETKIIDGIFSPKILDFRVACAVLNKCDVLVGPEGGFGHVAAALKKKAVLYFGGWISPNIIGYDFHENIYFENRNSPCGQYKSICKHCTEARKKITVNVFKKKLLKALNN